MMTICTAIALSIGVVNKVGNAIWDSVSRELARDGETGAAVVEYGIALAFIVVVAVTGMIALGRKMQMSFVGRLEMWIGA